ncbi:MAG TPA: phosphotransferase [Candidatus Binatia bacterium]|nr:phosphotransferase [Candidatus Binatia bacterium]
MQLTGFIRQLNASPDSNLIRFETTGPAVWFKAVGKRNLREFFVTIKLSELLPAFIPEIVAIKPECQGWLAREVAGTSLGETSDAALWEDAAARLARLQIESIPFIETLLPAGAHDIRSHALRSAVAPFFDLISRLMDEQPRSSPAVLGRQELSLIRDLIDDALVTLDQQEIPAALGHMDLNPWNMIVAPHGCVFLDWAEAYVGCPFFSFEYLLQHFRRQIGASPAFESRLTLAYKRHWAQLLSGERIDEALSLARLIAVFAYAVGNRAWGDEQKLKDPSAAGYLRSLARRMGREAAQLSEWRPPCPA